VPFFDLGNSGHPELFLIGFRWVQVVRSLVPQLRVRLGRRGVWKVPRHLPDFGTYPVFTLWSWAWMETCAFWVWPGPSQKARHGRKLWLGESSPSALRVLDLSFRNCAFPCGYEPYLKCAFSQACLANPRMTLCETRYGRRACSRGEFLLSPRSYPHSP